MTIVRPTAANDARPWSSMDMDTGLVKLVDARRDLARGPFGRVVDMSVSPFTRRWTGHSSSYQVCLPYVGLFGYRVGRRQDYYDANNTLFVTKGQDFEDTHPVAGVGHAAVIIEPDPALLEELCGSYAPANDTAFTRATLPATARLRLLTQALRGLEVDAPDPLRRDELVVAALREAMFQSRAPRAASSRLTDRAKQVLHAHGFDRLSLADIAREVGCSPAYLTQEFKRREGEPLYRYQMRLRLSHALVELPHNDNITGLALDLGFSSHSHFASAFKSAYRVTPSQYRDGFRDAG